LNTEGKSIREGATKLLKLFGDVTVSFLVIMLNYARDVKTRGYGASETESEIRRNFTAALDHCRVEASKLLGPCFSDENGPDYVVELVRLIRKELESSA